MAIPIIFGAAAAVAAAVGVAKGVKGVVDSNEANEIQKEVNGILSKSKDSFNKVKESTTIEIQELGKIKIESFANEIKDFIETFSKIKNAELIESKELSKFNLTKEEIEDMRFSYLKATDILGSGIAGIGAGALLGWGVYGGVMALGTASTGTAIGGLSGIAATNATLAWLGGGSLAVGGGGGIALGTTILGGIIAGPALLIAGGIFGAKAEEILNNAKSNLSEVKKIKVELETAELELNAIKEKTIQMSNLIKKLAFLLKSSNEAMRQVVQRSTDWRIYSEEEKNIVTVAIKNAQILKKVMDIPLLTEEGKLSDELFSTEIYKLSSTL